MMKKILLFLVPLLFLTPGLAIDICHAGYTYTPLACVKASSSLMTYEEAMEYCHGNLLEVREAGNGAYRFIVTKVGKYPLWVLNGKIDENGTYIKDTGGYAFALCSEGANIDPTRYVNITQTYREAIQNYYSYVGDVIYSLAILGFAVAGYFRGGLIGASLTGFMASVILTIIVSAHWLPGNAAYLYSLLGLFGILIVLAIIIDKWILSS